MSILQVLFYKLIRFVRKLTARDVESQPDATLPKIEVVSADEIDPELLSDIESQLLRNASGDDMQLLSVEIDAQGNPRIVVHPSRDINQVIDEATLQRLDAEWHEAKTARTG